jgi:enoyl-CoA hydratase
VIRAAKASLNAIESVEMADSYRLEQGYTFELNLLGLGDRARDAFLRGERDQAPTAD